MTIEELIIYGKKYIHSNEAKMLLAAVTGYDSLELLLHLKEKVSTELVDKYKTMIYTRLENYPLQYIIGNVNFYGYEFKVKENVLIPRFETEQLVYRVYEFIKNNFSSNLKVIDLGCGSGVIGITLKKLLDNVDVTCLDISNDALDLTRENAMLLDADIRLIKGNMLEEINEKFDVIVSNPPYIKTNEEIEGIVKDNEPHLALYGGVDGLDFYKEILSKAQNNLNDKFLIAFEIGETQKDDIINLANKYFDNIKIECYKDLAERDRVILIYKNIR